MQRMYAGMRHRYVQWMIISNKVHQVGRPWLFATNTSIIHHDHVSLDRDMSHNFACYALHSNGCKNSRTKQYCRCEPLLGNFMIGVVDSS